jgi:hypothetical protein
MEQIKSIEKLTPDDIRRLARTAFDLGETIADCPFPAGSDQANRWQLHFNAFERDEVPA